MKNFLRFLSEARQSAASIEAKNKGLVYDSQRSGWMNPKTRELVARTEKGKLKFVTKRGTKGEEEAPSKEKTDKKPEIKAKTTKIDLKKSQSKPVEKEPETSEEEVATDTLTVTFGRFNPPTIGHEKLLDISMSKGSGVHRVYATQSQDNKKNPLDWKTKIKYMRKVFPKHARHILMDKRAKTIFDVLTIAHDDGFKNVELFVGQDRLKEFETLVNKYNGVKGRHGFYDFASIKILSAGDRDPDADGAEGMSASKMRAAASAGDFDTFKMGVPSGFRDALKLYNDVRKNMGIREERDMGEMTDFESLRDLYLTGKLWNIGDIVEAKGVKGKVINKGTNYLSFVDENNKVHKTWLYDINEKKFDIDFKKRYSETYKGIFH